jgi:hypothetical protein
MTATEVTCAEQHTMETLDLERMSGAAASADGRTVRFEIHGHDGQRVAVCCVPGELEKMIHFLVHLGQLAAERRHTIAPRYLGPSDNITVAPIEVSDVGLMRAMEADDVVLVARMSGFDLGFSVTPYQLRALHKEIERVVPRAMLHADDHHHHHGDGDHDHKHEHGHGHHHHPHDHGR